MTRLLREMTNSIMQKKLFPSLSLNTHHNDMTLIFFTKLKEYSRLVLTTKFHWLKVMRKT